MQCILECSVPILFQLIQKPHFEQVAHKEILMCRLIKMVSMSFYVSSLMVVVILSQVIKCILQPEKQNLKNSESWPLRLYYQAQGGTADSSVTPEIVSVIHWHYASFCNNTPS
jgi:hypothetical protein